MKINKDKIIHNVAHMLVLSMLLLAGVASANVGKVIYGYGDNYALDNDGNRRVMKKGSGINEGDTLVTGRGRMHIRLIDGGFVSVYPNSEYKIEKFKFSGATASRDLASNTSDKKESKPAEESRDDRGFFNLLKGAARQVTGLLGRKYNKNFKFKTTVATIGIRGTGFFARLCQADCFDADGNPMQDGMYVKNNTGIITMTTNVGDVSLAQGQSAFVANSEETPQQTVQPPVVYNVVTPDLELFDFDEKVLAPVAGGSDDGGLPDAPVVPPVTPSVVVTNMEYVTSDTTFFAAPLGGLDTTKPSDSVQQTGDEINHFEGRGVYIDSGVLVFDKSASTLQESGSDISLGVLWNRWSSGYTFTEGGTDVPGGSEAGSDIHLIGSDNITPNLTGLTGRGTVNYSNTGGTRPTITGFAANQTGTQTIDASIDYGSAMVTNFQLDVTFGATTMTTILLTPTSLSGTSGNPVSLTGTCSGPECGPMGGGVNGETTINLVGPNAEGIYGVYNLTSQDNAVSGSYLATDAAIVTAPAL